MHWLRMKEKIVVTHLQQNMHSIRAHWKYTDTEHKYAHTMPHKNWTSLIEFLLQQYNLVVSHSVSAEINTIQYNTFGERVLCLNAFRKYRIVLVAFVPQETLLSKLITINAKELWNDSSRCLCSSLIKLNWNCWNSFRKQPWLRLVQELQTFFHFFFLQIYMYVCI